jgi:hypothetical protein
MTDIRSLERTLLDNLPWNKASIKFLVRFLLALYDLWTVNREASASRILLANSPNKELMRFIRPNLKNLRGGD